MEYPFTFACQRSGNCCARPEGVVRVDPQEVAQLAALLAMPEPAFRARYVEASGDRLKDGLGGRCVFLQDGREAACAVYAARPAQCRTWPFWPELRDDPQALQEAMRVCPGIRLRPGPGTSPQ